jgi:hypothetical protein
MSELGPDQPRARVEHAVAAAAIEPLLVVIEPASCGVLLAADIDGIVRVRDDGGVTSAGHRH